MSERFVFLDRDGTIIVEKDYLSDPAQVVLLPGAIEGMSRLCLAGVKLVIVTNQSGIGRGYYTEDDYQRVTQRMLELLKERGVIVEGVYHCPHAPAQECDCRKPLDGMIRQAANDFGTDFSEAVVIGDKPADINLGKAVGATTILVRTGYGREHEQNKTCEPDFIADSLFEAADWILADA